MIKTKEQILNLINKYRVNIWSNPNRPSDIQNDCCEYCGREHGKTPYMVHVTIDGTILPNLITEEDLKLVGMVSQGCFALGSTCAKKLLGNKIDDYIIKI